MTFDQLTYRESLSDTVLLTNAHSDKPACGCIFKRGRYKDAVYCRTIRRIARPRVSPEAWILDWERMSRPGNIDMQFELNCDFKINIEMFPVFQKYFRTYQPPALVIWGKHDVFFDVEEASCYKRDLPNAQVHILDGGHKANNPT